MSTIAVAIPIMLGLLLVAPFMLGTHAHGITSDVKTVGEYVGGKALPSDGVGPAINTAKAGLCSDNRQSTECGIGGAALDTATARVEIAEARVTIAVIVAVISIASAVVIGTRR